MFPGVTVVRSVAFKSRGTLVGVQLVRTGQPPQPFAWVIKAKANYVPMEAGAPVNLPGGIVATLVEGNPGPVAPCLGLLVISGGARLQGNGWMSMHAPSHLPAHCAEKEGGRRRVDAASAASWAVSTPLLSRRPPSLAPQPLDG